MTNEEQVCEHGYLGCPTCDAESRAYPDPAQSRQQGLTKRELFAAMAMQGMLARRQAWDDMGIKDFAGEAVDYADALLTALRVSENNNGT